MNLKLQSAPCDVGRLEAFLGGELSEASEQEFTIHLSLCESCRRALQERAAEPQAWLEAEKLLRPAEYDSKIEDHQPSQPLQIQNVLNALCPTDDPAMLGRLGGYEVSGVVGAGGMGVVLKAIDKSLDRTVAIKVLAPHLATSGAARKRFAREAKAAAAVLHPNVIAIHSVSNEQSLPYLVMPYVRGTSLQKRLDAEGPLSLQEILRIGAQIAAGLAAAHAQGLVHRDIKPANILLEEGVERVTITDFGLARAVDDASVTHSGMIAGTPQFMSPEQARGEAVDGRSDLFSLGSVLYALCTGRPPFRAETSYGVLRRITDDEPTPIREINPEIPGWLCQIISKLMSKRAGERFQSAGEVSDLFEKCLAHVQQPESVSLPPSCLSLAKGRAPFAERKATVFRPLFGVIAMIATILLTVLGIVAWQAFAPPDIAGKWTGPDWGEVVLEQKEPGEYAGTYTDTFKERPGTIELKWSRLEGRYKGTWQEANERQGKISVRLVDGEIRGAWTTSKKSGINPGNPELADLLWKRSGDKNQPSETAEAKLPAKVKSDNELLQGFWTLQESYGNGKKLGDDDKSLWPHELWIHDNEYTELFTINGKRSGGQMGGTLLLDQILKPKQITIVSHGSERRGIYKLEEDTLTICWAEVKNGSGGKDSVRPDDFRTLPGSGRLLHVYTLKKQVLVDIYDIFKFKGEERENVNKMAKSLSGLAKVLVSFRESGKSDSPFVVVVRDPYGLCKEDLSLKAAIQEALYAANVKSVRWDELASPAAVPSHAIPGIRVTLRLDNQQHSRQMLEKNVGFDQLSIMGSGVSGTTPDGKASDNLVVVLAHGCRLESFEETEDQGKKCWSAKLFVPQDSTSDGSNRDLSQKRIDQMQGQGVRFWLDHYRDQAPNTPKLKVGPPTNAGDGTAPRLSGLVVELREQELVKISLGVDDGIRLKDTLDVFRDKAYVGRITVQQVTADQSVARIEAQEGEIRRGDRVELAPKGKPAGAELVMNLGFERNGLGAATSVSPVLLQKGQIVQADGFRAYLEREKGTLIRQHGDDAAKATTVRLNVDQEVRFDAVTSLMKLCQEVGFQNFTLRLDEEAVEKFVLEVLRTPFDYDESKGSWQDGAYEMQILLSLNLMQPRERVVKTLLKVVDRSEKGTMDQRRLAMMSLGGIAPKQVLPLLIKELEGAKNLPVGKFKESFPYHEISVLEDIGEEAKDAIPVLVRVLDLPDGQARQLALLALVKIGPTSDEVMNAIAAMFGKPDEPVWSRAVYEVGRYGKQAKPLGPTFVKLLDAKPKEARIWAAQALVTSGFDEARGFDELMRDVAAGESADRGLAATALAALGSRAKSMIPKLRAFENDADAHVAKEVQDAIRRIEKDDRIFTHAEEAAKTRAARKVYAEVVEGKTVAASPAAVPTSTAAAGPKVERTIPVADRVHIIAISPDGKLIAIVHEKAAFADAEGRKREIEIVEEGKGKTLKVTTKEEDELLAAIEGLPHVEIGPVAFSPDSELVAVGTGLGQVKFFKARTGELVRTLDDEKAKLAEKETPEKLKALKRAMGGVGTLAFSPDGNLLAMTGSSFEDVGANWGGIERLRLPVVGPGRLKIWDVKTGALKHDLAGHSQAFTAGFTFDGSVLVSAGRGITSNHDNGIIAWNPQTGEKLTAIPIVANGGTHSLAFSPTKKLVAVSSILFDKENNTSSTSLRLIYPLSGITEWDRNLPGWAAPKGFSADGKFVAVLRGEAAIEFLDVETASTKQEIMAEGFLPDKPREGARWTDAMIAPRAGKLVIGGVGKDRKGSVEIWDLSGLGAAAAKKDDQKQ